jgi:hypothetical protein
MKALLALILFASLASPASSDEIKGLALCGPITKETYNEIAKIIDDLSHWPDEVKADSDSFSTCLNKPLGQVQEACEKENNDRFDNKANAMVVRLLLFNFKVACWGVELSHTGSISVRQYRSSPDASMIITYDDTMPVSVSQTGLR